jgi:hypothetical protein
MCALLVITFVPFAKGRESLHLGKTKQAGREKISYFKYVFLLELFVQITVNKHLGLLPEKIFSPSGNRTRAFHVTGGDPYH